MDSKSPLEIPSKNNFTAIRFLLAFIVVLCHLSELSEVPAFAFLYENLSSMLAIHGFFIISGFLIYRSYLRNPQWKKYIIKRLKRILPAYIAVVLICAIALASVSTLKSYEYFLNPGFWKYLLTNFLTLNFLQPDLPGVFQNNLYTAVNGSLWTIKVELAFYFLLPVIVWILLKTKEHYHIWVFTAIYILSIAYSETFLYLYEKTGREIFNTLNRQLPGKLAYFVSGMILYYFFESFKKYSSLHFILSLIILILARVFESEWPVPLSLGIVIIYMVLCTPPWFSKLDKHDYSYGIYLWHFPIIQTFTALHLFDKNPWIMFVAAILLIFTIAAISWYGLERKILDSRS